MSNTEAMMIFREGGARRRRTLGKAKRAHPKGHSTTILGEATLGMAALPPKPQLAITIPDIARTDKAKAPLRPRSPP